MYCALRVPLLTAVLAILSWGVRWECSNNSLMNLVHAVRVFKNGSHGGKVLGNDLVLEVGEPTDVAALRITMRIIDGSGGHCMCFGGPTLEMLSADRSRLALLSIHHGLAIRWDRWKDDAKLVDGRLLLEWLAERGVVDPLREFEAMEASHLQGKQDRDRWLAAMPSALIPVWSSALGQFGSVNVDPLLAALESAMPDEGERILALLEWFGSGAGPWSGFPSYEQAAEELLLDRAHHRGGGVHAVKFGTVGGSSTSFRKLVVR